ncbi:copper resistance CopC family protein [Microbacterium sp. NPDC055903]
MSAATLRRPSPAYALVAVLLAAALALIPAGRASAHDSLVASDPAADSTVETLPAQLTLTFSAALIDAPDSTAVVVTSADGKTVSEGPAEIDGAVLTQTLNPEGAAAGEYTVLWQMVSSDGHPTDGSFTFTVTTGSAVSEPTPVETETPDAAEPTASAPTETADPTVAPAPEETGSDGASVWIWVLAIGGILLAGGAAVWLSLRGRRDPSDSDSDTPAER